MRNISVVLYSPPATGNIATIYPLLETYYSEFGDSPELVNWLLPYIHYNNDLDSVVLHIVSENPQILGIGRYVWNESQVDYVAKRVKEQCPNIVIVAGGPHQDILYNSTPFAGREYVDAILEPGFYGEVFFTAILNMMTSDIPINWNQVCGAVFKGPNGVATKSTVKFNARDFVWPSTDYVERHSTYFETCYKDYNNSRYMFIPYETNRGCPYSCSFCEWGIGALKKINLKPEEVVLQEIKSIVKYCSATYIVDANFGQFDRDIAFVEEFVHNAESAPKMFDIKFSGWAKNKKQNLLQIYKLLLKSDYIEFSDDKGDVIAVQDFNQDVKSINNRFDLSFDDTLDFVQQINSLGHYPAPQLIIGLPGQTIETHWANINIILKFFNNANKVSFSLFCLLPDTPAADPEFIEKYKIKTRKLTDNQMIVTETVDFSYLDLLEMYISMRILSNFLSNGICPSIDDLQKMVNISKKQQFYHDLVDEYYNSKKDLSIDYNVSNYVTKVMSIVLNSYKRKTK